MAGALFARIKTWTAEVLNFADLNAEIQNILDKLIPIWIDDHSSSVSQMQLQTSPGAQGSESQATSLAGEIERLRFVIQRMLGSNTTYWYDAPGSSLSDLSAGLSFPNNRIVSGAVRSASDSFPIFLTADGTANSVTLNAASTNFVYRVDGVEYTLSSDVQLTGLSQAPSSNNTALLNDGSASNQNETRIYGENNTKIIMDTAGSEITSIVGDYQAFKINDGSTDEYFYAYVLSTTVLNRARRGFFFDSSNAPVTRVPIADNDTITLLRVAYIFITTGGTLAVTYNLPTVSATEPTSPASGDYWYDLVNDTWKSYNGSTFVAANATYIGMACTDSSNTVGARSERVFHTPNDVNTLILTKNSSSTIGTSHTGGRVAVLGTEFNFYPHELVWDMTAHLDDDDAYDGSEQASTPYFFYIDDTGKLHISDQHPYDELSTIKGYYHPYHNWRLIGFSINNASSNLGGARTFPLPGYLYVHTGNGHGSTNTAIRRFATGQGRGPAGGAIGAGGSPFFFEDNSGAGSNFTVTKSGAYHIFYSDIDGSSGFTAGISLNTSTPATTFVSISTAEQLTAMSTNAAGEFASSGISIFLDEGDIVTAHTDGGPTNGVDETRFSITELRDASFPQK